MFAYHIGLRTVAVLVLGMMFLTSCKPTSQAELIAKKKAGQPCRPSSSKSKASLQLADDSTKTATDTKDTLKKKEPARKPISSSIRINFEDHVLGLLASKDDDFVYKCTVCHQQMESADYVRDDFERILDSMAAGRMPNQGNRVSSFDVELFKRWKDDGFRLNKNDPGRRVVDIERTGSTDTESDGSAPCAE